MTLAAALMMLFAASASAHAAIPSGGRAYELVTIPGPTSSRLIGNLPMEANGDEFPVNTVGPPPGTESGAIIGYMIARRGPEAWTRDTTLGIPYHTEYGQIFKLFEPEMPIAFSEDLRTRLWVSTVPLAPGGQPEQDLGLYRASDGGAPEFVADVGHSGNELIFEAMLPRFADIAGDGSRVVFTTEQHLVAADAGRTEGESIYAWSGGSPELVDVDNGGNEISNCGARISPAGGMSRSAHLVFFTTPAAPGLCGEPERVFVRNLATHTTVEISASQCTRLDCNAADDVSFAGATREGEFAYLTTKQQLTNDDEDAGLDLYRYDVSSGDLSLVSGAPTPVSGEVVRTLVGSGIPTTPEDGDRSVFPAETGERVYFEASGEIIPGESTSGEKLFMADASGLHLVADAALPVKNAPLLIETPLQMTPDGSRAYFVTASKALPSDTDSAFDDYLYDAASGDLTQISIGPAGGNAELPSTIEALSPVNSREYLFGDWRTYFSIDAAGDRVIFETRESLLPEDTNGLSDVYEWHDGELGLISPASLPYMAQMGGISRDGKTVLFTSNARLLPSDVGGVDRDLYAARIGGGYPEALPSCESTDSCPPLATADRVSRPAPPSLATTPAAPGKLRLAAGTAREKKGAIRVAVTAPRPGLLSGQLWVKGKGKKKRRVVLAAGTATALRPGSLGLSLRLTHAGRGLRAGKKKATLSLSEGSLELTRTLKVSFR